MVGSSFDINIAGGYQANLSSVRRGLMARPAAAAAAAAASPLFDGPG